MAKPICGDLQPTFDLLTDMGLLEKIYSNCFTVNSGIEMGTYILLGGAVSLNILNQLITRAATAAIQDREARFRGDLNPWSLHNQPDSFFRNNLMYYLWFLCCCLRYVGDVGSQNKGYKEESAEVEDSGRVSILSSQSNSSGVNRKRTHKPIFSRRRVSTAVYIPVGKGDLPPHWESVKTDDGKTYYWHTLSGVTQWEKPEIDYSLQTSKDMPSSFEMVETFTSPESRV